MIDNSKITMSSQDEPLFSQLALNEPLLNNLDSLGYVTMTPIQFKSLPRLLTGCDVIARAKTGSGKTVAFGLTILNRINLKFFGAQALVLCPTRELAEQVSQAIRQLARQMPNVKIINLSGGLPMRPQQDSLRHGSHIVVGTPGRVLKHLEKETLVLNNLAMLVLDEADRMLDMGFLDDMQSIRRACPNNRQTLLFSATYPPEIKALSHEFMHNPEEIFIEQALFDQQIDQVFYETRSNTKFMTLVALLKHHQPISTLIFCNTKQRTIELTELLNGAGFNATALNGDMEQVDRDLSIIQFTNQSCAILVATDVAARGLDIKELPLVINYELAFESDVHTHRIGRTGRAGHKGIAITLTTAADAERLLVLEDANLQPLTWENVANIPENNKMPSGPHMVTLCLDVGKKDKIRAGDILGALTKDAALPNDAIGKIDILPLKSYVAIHKNHATSAYQYFQKGKLKGRSVYVRKL
ncbi:MAG: ATP-dependent RNA helicase DbpA [Legionellaceae bacterium]|nr:ATP-dependent RNA helicase DbpA [Legionellaceae bacterium]